MDKPQCVVNSAVKMHEQASVWAPVFNSFGYGTISKLWEKQKMKFPVFKDLNLVRENIFNYWKQNISELLRLRPIRQDFSYISQSQKSPKLNKTKKQNKINHLSS